MMNALERPAVLRPERRSSEDQIERALQKITNLILRRGVASRVW
jgi:hypothetical protein